MLLGFGSPLAIAEAIVPANVQYASSVDENGQAKICQIVATITNAVPPERVDFTAFAGYDKLEGAVAVGFLAGAAKRSPSGEFELVAVASAAFNSTMFNSADELDHEISGDGTVMAATADGPTADRFLRSVTTGDFYLTLSSDQPEIGDWTYEIADGPPDDVQQSFAACLQELVPGTVSFKRDPFQATVQPHVRLQQLLTEIDMMHALWNRLRE
jgi:hypothetical protein